MAKIPDVRRGFFTNPDPGSTAGQIELVSEVADTLLNPGETLTRLVVYWRGLSANTAALDNLNAIHAVALAVTFGNPPGNPIPPTIVPSDGQYIWWERAQPQQLFTTGGNVIGVVGDQNGTKWETRGQRTAPPTERGSVWFAWDFFTSAPWAFAVSFSAVVLEAP